VPQTIAPNDSKVRPVALGRKTVLIFDDIGRWWNGPWHGRSLALHFVGVAIE
jgi:hypothetical protein